MKGIFKEKILFARLKAQDRQAFIEAYDLYVDKIYRFVFYKVLSREEAEDLTSMVFLKSWNHIIENNLAQYHTLPALFYKIARNSVIDHYRKVGREQNNLSLDDPAPGADLPDDKQDFRRQVELASDLLAVNEKLSELKDEYREVIILRFIEELSIGEIAAIIDKSHGNVRILVFRALKALRELMNDSN